MHIFIVKIRYIFSSTTTRIYFIARVTHNICNLLWKTKTKQKYKRKKNEKIEKMEKEKK